MNKPDQCCNAQKILRKISFGSSFEIRVRIGFSDYLLDRFEHNIVLLK